MRDEYRCTDVGASLDHSCVADVNDDMRQPLENVTLAEPRCDWTQRQRRVLPGEVWIVGDMSHADLLNFLVLHAERY